MEKKLFIQIYIYIYLYIMLIDMIIIFDIFVTQTMIRLVDLRQIVIVLSRAIMNRTIQ